MSTYLLSTTEGQATAKLVHSGVDRTSHIAPVRTERPLLRTSVPMDHMQQSETDIELFSSSAVSPIDERHISMLFDASTNGTIRGSRKNGDTLRTNRSPCAKPAPAKKRRKLQDGAPKWERRTVKISIHFFYVIAIGVLFCLVIYLIILNRSIYSAVYQADDRFLRPSAQENVVTPVTDPAPVALDLRLRENATRLSLSISINSTSITSRSTVQPTLLSTKLLPTRPRPSTVSPTMYTQPAQNASTQTSTRLSFTNSSTDSLTLSSTLQITNATTSLSNGTCPAVVSGATTIIVQPTGLRLYVGPIGNRSEAVSFCSKLVHNSSRIQLVQFSESSKFENTRENLERLIEEQSAAVWVNAVVVDYNWYWNNWNEQISVSEEMDADESVESSDCVVLQKRNTELRLEGAECYNVGLVVCECSISF